MTAASWEEMAGWYDAKQGNEGDLWHRTLIDPTFLRVVGDIRGLQVLDLACGNGYLSRKYAEAGAKVVAVDGAAPMIERAMVHEKERPLGIEYQTADAAHMPQFKDGAFDLVTANMALMDIQDTEGAIREVGRVLKGRGRFVASLSHPCFDQGSTSTWLTERFFTGTRVWRKIERYRHPLVDEIPWDVGGRTITTPGYHRPLSWYARALRDAGLLIRALEEPEPTQEFLDASPQGSYLLEIPLHLIIEAVKLKA